MATTRLSTVHFFKAHSRMGMIHFPFGGSEPNVGVEDAPEFILSDSFLKSIVKRNRISSFQFPLPESIDKATYPHVIAETSKQFADKISNAIFPGEIQVVVGGDHSVSLGSVMALLRRTNVKKMGYVQFDSHGDVCTFSGSPSGNFHGMFARALTGEFDNTEIVSVLPRPIPTKNMIFVGNLDIDSGEEMFMRLHAIPNISRPKIEKNPVQTMERFDKWLSRFEHIHISFDIDVFDRSLVSATGTPSHAGFLWEHVGPFLNRLSLSKSISIDMAEVNPKKPGAAETVALAQRVLKTLLN